MYGRASTYLFPLLSFLRCDSAAIPQNDRANQIPFFLLVKQKFKAEILVAVQNNFLYRDQRDQSYPWRGKDLKVYLDGKLRIEFLSRNGPHLSNWIQNQFFTGALNKKRGICESPVSLENRASVLS